MKWTGVREVMLAAVLLFGVAACTWTSIQPDGEVAQRVYVTGEFNYVQSARVAQTAAQYMGVPLFEVDVQAMAAALKALPWLASVSIDRRWPDGVVIRVTEHEPLALWNEHSVLTSDFTVVTPKHGNLQLALAEAGLPHLSGPPGTGKRVYIRFKNMNQRLMAASDVRLTALQLDARGSWRATLANGLVLRFGRKHLAARLQRFIDFALAKARTALIGAGYVDLRYSDGFAVGGTRALAARERGNEQKA